MNKLIADIGITGQPSNSGVQVAGKSGAYLMNGIVSSTTILFFTIGAVAVLIMFLWGAVEWIFSGGDKEKVAGARKRITTAIIGVFLLALAFIIIGIISQISGFNILGQFTIPSWNKP